jgi:hypothetical protein
MRHPRGGVLPRVTMDEPDQGFSHDARRGDSMPTLTPTQSGHDMSRKFFTEAVKRWAEQELDSPEQVAFVVDMMDGAYELVVDSARNGGAPSNADVRKFLLKRSAKFVGMADASMVQCAVALIDLGYTATAYSKVAAMPVVGYVVYGSMLVLDGLTAGGECYLAYEDRRIEREIRAFEQQLTDRKAWAKSNAALAVRSPMKVVQDFHNMLEWKARQPTQCTAPVSGPVFRLP